MQVVQLVLKVRQRPCSRLFRRVLYMQIDSHTILVGPGFGRMSGGIAHSAPVFLYTKPSSSSSRILSRINFSCGGAYLRADIRTGSAPWRSLMTRGFTFAGGSAQSLSLKTSLHSVTNFRKLCTPSQDMPAFSALVIKPSMASASSSGLPCPTSKS
jgi:hypothetical protein